MPKNKPLQILSLKKQIVITMPDRILILKLQGISILGQKK
jgi:hypothetical protein